MNYEKFKPLLGDWGEFLKPFIESKECDQIYSKLKTDSAKGVRMCPNYEDTYRAFKECPWGDLKVVIVGQDPYPWVKGGVKVADGVAFSCKYTQKLQPSLELFYDAIEKELYKGLDLQMYKSPDLSYLANQGVLLLNAALTTRENIVGAHTGSEKSKNLWGPFTEYVLKLISLTRTNIVFLLLGEIAQWYEEDISKEGNYIYKCEHPARAARLRRPWQTDHIFSLTQETLKSLKKLQLDWLYEEAPF